MDEGGYFPQLSRCWDIAEELASTWSNWHQLAVWATFCALHSRARANLLNGERELRKSQIDLDYLVERISDSVLADYSGYPRQMRKEARKREWLPNNLFNADALTRAC